MKKLQYIIRPLPSGGYTTQVKYKGTRDQAYIVAQVVARTGKSEADVRAILGAHDDVLIEETIDSYKCASGGGKLGFAVSTGGKSPTSDVAPTWDNLHTAFNGYYLEEGVLYAQSLFSAEKVGEQGRVVPVIIRVTDLQTGFANHYHAAKSIEIEVQNQNARFDHAAGCTVEFEKPDGTKVEASDYGSARGRVFSAQVPAGLTGPLIVHVKMLVSGGQLREGIYAIAITP
jgi:hypothetical protein